MTDADLVELLRRNAEPNDRGRLMMRAASRIEQLTGGGPAATGGNDKKRPFSGDSLRPTGYGDPREMGAVNRGTVEAPYAVPLMTEAQQEAGVRHLLAARDVLRKLSDGQQ